MVINVWQGGNMEWGYNSLQYRRVEQRKIVTCASCFWWIGFTIRSYKLKLKHEKNLFQVLETSSEVRLVKVTDID